MGKLRIGSPEELSKFINNDSALSSLRGQIENRLSSEVGHDLSHSLRVALWTLRLIDDEVSPRHAVAAALCHDLVNVPKNSPNRSQASSLSAQAASKLLRDHGFDDATITSISEAIRDHSYSRGAIPTSPLGQALQDADRLDALGAIGVMRAASVGATMGRKFYCYEDPWAATRPPDDRLYLIDHFFTKLLNLPRTMLTSRGRTEAMRRIQVMQDFLDALSHEIAAPRPEGRTLVAQHDSDEGTAPSTHPPTGTRQEPHD